MGREMLSGMTDLCFDVWYTFLGIQVTSSKLFGC